MAAAPSLRVLYVAALIVVGCGASTGLADDTGPPEREVETSTASPSPDGDVDVVGTWYSCVGVFELSPDGTWQLEGNDGCFATGPWSVEGQVLEWTVTAGDCVKPPAVGAVQAIVHDNALVLHSSVYADGTYVLLDETTPRSDWRLEGNFSDLDGVGSNIMHVIGTPHDGFSSACYWSEDETGFGLLSYGGWVEIWRLEDGAFRAKTSCSGDCPCGAVLSGEIQADGSIAGSYNSANCARMFSGEFTLTPWEP